MIPFKQLEELSEFKNADFLMSSFYLSLKRGRATNKEAKITTKAMIKETSEKLQGQDLNKMQLESIYQDFATIQNTIESIEPGKNRGIALFSCSGANFWQHYILPRCYSNTLIVGPQPYQRPLKALQEEYKRYCVVVVERERARIFGLYMEEIEDYSSIFHEVPPKVKEGGWYGREERKIQRHIEDHAHRHYKRAAELTMQFFKDYRFDWIILGGSDEVLKEFENHLHSYLRQRLVGKFTGEVGKASLNEILQKSLEITSEVERKLEQELVGQIIDKYRNGGLAVVGLKNTLQTLTLGEVHTLAVSDDLYHRGIICRNCNFLGVDELVCPRCSGELEEIPDLISEAIDIAIQQNCQFQHLHSKNDLREEGGIGALLRFKV